MAKDRITNVIQGNKNNIKNVDVRKTIQKRTNITISVLFCIVIGCTIFFTMWQNNPEKLIVGYWQVEGASAHLEFTEDGTILSSSGNRGQTWTYKIQKNNRIQIDVRVLWGHGTVMADLKVTKDKLILSNIADPDDILSLGKEKSLVFNRLDQVE